MLNNGVVAIDRLQATKKSLERALIYINEELSIRDERQSLNTRYVRRTLDLQTSAANLEDDIRSALL